jgi:hypothetical protein
MPRVDGAIQFLLVMAAMFGVIGGLARYRKVRRRAAIEAVAQEAGWTFERGPMYPADLRIGRFPVFNRGRSQRASNAVRTTLGATEAPYIVRDLFTSSLRAYFEQHEGWTVEGEGDELLVYRQGRLAIREELRPRIDEALATASVFEW